MQERVRTIGEIVAEDYRTAKVFQKYDMDFCCGGNVALSEVCSEKGIEISRIMDELNAAKEGMVEKGRDYATWELPFLIDFIVNVHHTYITENIDPLSEYIYKINEVHGAIHPELREIATVFKRIAAELLLHLKEEEEELFPAVKRLDRRKKAGEQPEARDLETLSSLLDRFVADHEAVGEAIHWIHHLSGGYTVPADGCNTYAVAYQKLKEFEDDLHKHVHLENNILFPKADRLRSFFAG